MYRATSDQKYLTALEGMTVRTGLDWSTVGDYGNIAILTMNGIDKESAVYTRAESSVIAQADTLVKTADKTAYGAPLQNTTGAQYDHCKCRKRNGSCI